MSRLRTSISIGAVSLLVAASASAQEAHWGSNGAIEWDRLGTSVVHVPDVDGDGVDDVLAGAPGVTDQPGKAYLYSGATLTVIREFVGDTPGGDFGTIVADLGDVDGDGVRDYAFTAPDRGYPTAPYGAIFVVSGTGTVLRTVTSTATSGNIGASMCSLGDVDGVRDLLYSEWAGKTNKAVLVSGKTGARIRKHLFGNTDYPAHVGVAPAGDVDGDGVDDYFVDDDALKLHVYSGATGNELFAFTGVGIYPGSGFAAAGDVDGDGRGDLLLATDSLHEVVSVVSGATGNTLYTVSVFNADFPSAMSTAGDVDGDGRADFVIGSGTFSLNGQGRDGENLFLFSGATGSLVGAYFDGFDNGSWGPTSLDASADVDGDGVVDFVSGRPEVSVTFGKDYLGESSDNGAFFVVDSRDGSRREAIGVGYESELGASLTLVGDVDHDGSRDVAATAPYGIDPSGENAVVILSGSDGHWISTFEPNSALLPIGGSQVVNVGDVDGDGTDDLAVGCVASVEIRSGADNSLITTIVPPSDVPIDLAAGADVDGTPLLAVCTATNVFVYDLNDDSVVCTHVHDGSFAECLGDVNQDGRIDWVTMNFWWDEVDEVWHADVTAFSGLDGSTLWQFNVDDDGLPDTIRSIANVGDLDGDAIDDVVVSSYGWISQLGTSIVLSGATGTELYRIDDPPNVYSDVAGSPGDVDGDGTPDLLIGAGANFDVYSGRTARLLGEFATDLFEYRSLPKYRLDDSRRIDHDKHVDPLIGDRGYRDPGVFDGSAFRGRVERLDMHRIFCDVSPASPRAGRSATVTTRGGEQGNLVGLYLVDLSGAPLDYFFMFGTFNSNGVWIVSGSSPSSFKDETLTVASYGIGYDGKLEDTTELAITFR